jgi:hypothetical protein
MSEFSKGIPEAHYYEAQAGFDVYSWSPEPPGTRNAKCTQVHLHGSLEFGRVVWRFKSAAALDRLIEALIEHRTDVWGSE